MKDSCAANDAFVTELPSDECNLFWKFQTNSVTAIIIQNCCCKNRLKWCIKKYAFHACENANDFRLRYFFEICGEWNAFVDFIGWLLAQQTFETSICRFFLYQEHWYEPAFVAFVMMLALWPLLVLTDL